MIKYIVHHSRDSAFVFEVECEECFCYPWEVLPGEKKYKILSKTLCGEGSVLMSWAVYDSEALAINSAAGDIRASLLKGKIQFDEQELIRKVAAIVVKKLEK